MHLKSLSLQVIHLVLANLTVKGSSRPIVIILPYHIHIYHIPAYLVRRDQIRLKNAQGVK